MVQNTLYQVTGKALELVAAAGHNSFGNMKVLQKHVLRDHICMSMAVNTTVWPCARKSWVLPCFRFFFAVLILVSYLLPYV